MHKIQAKEFTLDDFSTENLNNYALQNLKQTIEVLNYNRERFLKTKDKEYNDIDNLIILKNVDRKFIDFYETKPNLIFHSNFVKQFGVNIDNVLSISEILAINKEYHRKQNEARMKQTSIILLNRNKGRHWRF